MTIPLSTVRNAAFWGAWVCLDCGSELHEFTLQCYKCGSSSTQEGRDVLAAYEAIEDDREEEE